jgi:hypothetical protein
MAPRDGLLGAARFALRVALAGDRRRCAASSNRLVVCRRFELAATNSLALLVRLELFFVKLAPRDGFEPPTNGLTVRRSTTELPGNSEEARIVGKPAFEVKESGVSDDGVWHVWRFQLRDFGRLELEGQGGEGIVEVLRL